MAPIQYWIGTVERWTMSDFLPIKPETISKNFELLKLNALVWQCINMYKHYMSKSETWQYWHDTKSESGLKDTKDTHGPT